MYRTKKIYEAGFSMVEVMVALSMLAIIIAGVATNSSMQILARKNTESKLSYRTVEEGLKFQMGEKIRQFVMSGGGDNSLASEEVPVGSNWILKYFKKDVFEDLSTTTNKQVFDEVKKPPGWFKKALKECETRSLQLVNGTTASFCMELKVRDENKKGKKSKSADTLMEGFSNFRYAFVRFDVAVRLATTRQLAPWKSTGHARIIEVMMVSYWVHKTPKAIKEVYHKRPSIFYTTNK